MTLRIVERRKYLFIFAMSDETEHFRTYRPKSGKHTAYFRTYSYYVTCLRHITTTFCTFLRRNKTILPSLCLLYVTEMWKLYLFSLEGASTFFLTDQLMTLRVTFSFKFSLRSLRTKCCEIIYPLFLREFIAKTSRSTTLGIENEM